MPCMSRTLGSQGILMRMYDAFGWREDRVILTHDTDFLNDGRFPPHRNPGVVVLPGAQGKDRSLAGALDRVTRIVRSRTLWRRTKITVGSDGSWVVATFEEDLGHTVTTRYRFRSGIEMWKDPRGPKGK